MATRVETLTENYYNSYKSTWTVTYSADDISVDQSSFTLPPLVLQTKYVYSGKNRGSATAHYSCSLSSGKYGKDSSYNGGTFVSGNTYIVADMPAGGDISAPPIIVQTGDLFDATNKTQRSVTFQYVLHYLDLYSAKSKNAEEVEWANEYIWGSYSGSTSWDIFTTLPKITLNVPPTATVGDLTFSTPTYKYAGLTTAYVNVKTSGTYGGASYGGDVTTITFTIGTQSVSLTGSSITGDDTLSIPLNYGGSFIPTITITDSRGQSTTYRKTQIDVSVYTQPSAVVEVERTYPTGAPYDEGENAVVSATLTFDSAIAHATAPTITVTDDLGVVSSPTVAWYSTRAGDGTLSGSVTWSNLSTGVTVYALLTRTGGFDPNKSYLITLTPSDDIGGAGTSTSQTLSTAFFTIDFLAGGHGIAFGRPATTAGFYVDMETHLLQGVDITGDMTASGTTESLDAYIDLPDYQTSGTDKAIYDAIVALGWDSDVLS